MSLSPALSDSDQGIVSDLMEAMKSGIPASTVEKCRSSSRSGPGSGTLVDVDLLQERVTAKDLEANFEVLVAVLCVFPSVAPAASLFARAFQKWDAETGYQLSHYKKKSEQWGWCRIEAEKVRSLLAHVRRLRMRSSSSNSTGTDGKNDKIKILKGLVKIDVKQPADLEEPEVGTDEEAQGAGGKIPASIAEVEAVLAAAPQVPPTPARQKEAMPKPKRVLKRPSRDEGEVSDEGDAEGREAKKPAVDTQEISEAAQHPNGSDFEGKSYTVHYKGAAVTVLKVKKAYYIKRLEGPLDEKTGMSRAQKVEAGGLKQDKSGGCLVSWGRFGGAAGAWERVEAILA